MKKGLRRYCAATGAAVRIPTADLMKKGLRRKSSGELGDPDHSNRRPDEEGIKTASDDEAAVFGFALFVAPDDALQRPGEHSTLVLPALLASPLETKLTPLAPEETAGPRAFARAVVAVLRAEGMLDRANVQSFDWRVLFEIRRLAPELPTVCLTAEQRWLDNIRRDRPGPSPWTAGLDVDDAGGSVPRLVEAAGCRRWSPYHRDLTAEALAEAHALGLKVVVWTVNEVDEMLALARMGVDGIITDYPDRAIEALAPWRPRQRRGSSHANRG